MARRSVLTAKNYVSQVRIWSRSQGYDNPDDLVELVRAGKVDPYKSLDDFVQWMLDNKQAPKTVASRFSTVKTFLVMEGVDLAASKLQRIQRPQRYILSRDRAPTIEELRRILLHCSNLKGKVVVSMLASSGMRLRELTTLKIGDIDFSKHPTRIYLRPENTKQRMGRTCFISDEATQFLNDYLNGRNTPEQYVFYAMRLNDQHAEISPLKHEAPMTIYRTVMAAVRRAGLQKKERSGLRYELHPHCFRKFFFTQMIRAVGRELAEAFLGHKLFQDTSYLRLTEDDLAKEYLKGMSAVTILIPSPEISREEIEAEKKKTEDLEKKYKELEKQSENIIHYINEAWRKSTNQFGVPADSQLTSFRDYLQDLADKGELPPDGLTTVGLPPSPAPQNTRYEVRSINKDDEASIIKAFEEGFEQSGEVNGKIVFRRLKEKHR